MTDALDREQPAMPRGPILTLHAHTNPSSVSAFYINTEVKKRS
jgi:hypothetical protein